MTQTTPAQERYTRFSCPNPQGARFNHPGEVNIVHRSWTGTHKHIERLRCTACDREFSERAGTPDGPQEVIDFMDLGFILAGMAEENPGHNALSFSGCITTFSRMSSAGRLA
jgi:hypothetical protein